MAGTFIGEPWKQPYTAQQIQDIIANGVPVVGDNGNWWRWDINTSAWVDTGITAATSLADNAVITSKLADGSVTTPKLADGSVAWPKLAPEARKSNDNLLDNAYFIGGGSQQGGGQFPINQRGLTEYTAETGTIYTIDRWSVEKGGKIAIADDGIVFTTPANGYCVFGQLIENYKALVGKTLTFSILIKENTVENVYLWAYGGVSGSNSYITTIQGPGLYTLTFTPNDTISQMRVGVQSRNSAGSVKIAAFKLELGPYQTLAHESGGGGGWQLNNLPNFSDELMRCQRYYIPPADVWSTAFYPNGGGLFAEIPCNMRSTPTPVGDGFQIYDSYWKNVTLQSVALWSPIKCMVKFYHPLTGDSIGKCYLLNKIPGLSCDL